MKKIIFSIIVAFAMVLGVNATEKNEVTLNFEGGIIHNDYVEYSKVANVQVFKDDNLVVDISNNMVIDLNESEYKFVIEEIENETVGVTKPGAIRLKINNWYYPISTSIVEGTKPSFKLESSKFNGKLNIKFEKANIAINTKVENIYNDISSKGVVDLTNGKEYVIDFSKNDELTEGLKSFADLEKTLYYKRNNNGLLLTGNENEAVIKIVGNKTKNNAILTAINVGNKKSDVFKGFHMQYTGAALDYNSTSDGIIYETRFDYYTRCTYEFTFKYVEDIQLPKEYQVIEGANQKYTIDKDSDMTFRIDADYSLFDKKVYIDNELVDVNNYTSKEGSTIIVFNKDYVSTLNVGKHTLKVVFSDNNEALTNFEIIKEEKNEIIKNPETIDNIEKYIAIGIVAVIGIIGSTLLIRKSKEK
jgi:putative LPXTG-motif protein cell wall anchor domain protein